MATLIRWQDGVPEVQPLSTVAELRAWTPSGDDSLCQAVVPLPPRRDGGLQAARPRLLACHDMRGGYLEDRLVQGGGDADAYTFRHWSAIDGFVYFSHRLVTVPPPCWTNAAHLHGVPVLGTLITEWDDGAAACAELFGSRAAAEGAAERLAAVASRLGFDGWVINIENALDVGLVPNLLHFLRTLTAAMHDAVAHSTVIWYDAVTSEGTLEWQNALNARNVAFFDATDGIWVNYTWQPPALAAARAAAGPRQWDVYAGVDCFGRGTYGGGGLRCDTALAAARAAGLSVALFAVAWPFEMHEMGAPPPAAAPPAQRYTWQAEDDEFWRRISAAWGPRRAVLRALPAASDFCAGAGRAFAAAGRPLRPAAWYNLSLQSLQPALAFRGGAPAQLVARVTSEAAFSGGSAVQLCGRLAGPVVLRLFKASAPLPAEGLRASFTAAVSRGVTLRLCLRLQRSRESAGGEEESVAVEMGPLGAAGTAAATAALQAGGGGRARAAFRPAAKVSEVPCTPLPGGAPGALGASAPSQWATWRCSLGPAELPGWALESCVLASVEVVAGPAVGGATCECNCLIGAVSIRPMCGESGAESVPVQALEASRVELDRQVAPGGAAVVLLSTLLRWAFLGGGGGGRRHVWVRFATAAAGAAGSPSKQHWSLPLWLGVACAPAYAVARLQLPYGATAARFFVAAGADSGALRQAAAATVMVGGPDGPWEHDALPV